MIVFSINIIILKILLFEPYFGLIFYAAAIAWHEERRKWVGDKSQHPPRMAKDPIIRYATSLDGGFVSDIFPFFPFY